jgi:hypothetical protein
MTTETPAPPPAAPPAAPSTPTEAATRLDTLRADPKWTTALLSGGPAQTREFHELHALVAKGDNVDMAMAGVMQPGIIQDSGHVEMMGTAAMLREMGFNPKQVRETLEGKPATQADIDIATTWKAQNMNSKEFRTRLFAGEPDAKRLLRAANIILSSPKETSA